MPPCIEFLCMYYLIWSFFHIWESQPSPQSHSHHFAPAPSAWYVQNVLYSRLPSLPPPFHESVINPAASVSSTATFRFTGRAVSKRAGLVHADVTRSPRPGPREPGYPSRRPPGGTAQDGSDCSAGRGERIVRRNGPGRPANRGIVVLLAAPARRDRP